MLALAGYRSFIYAGMHCGLRMTFHLWCTCTCALALADSLLPHHTHQVGESQSLLCRLVWAQSHSCIYCLRCGEHLPLPTPQWEASFNQAFSYKFCPGQGGQGRSSCLGAATFTSLGQCTMCLHMYVLSNFLGRGGEFD